jgi:MFS family permease
LSQPLYVLGASLWVLWVQLVSFSIGGYVAARLRARHGDALDEHEVDVRDGLHGLLAWGVGVIAAAIIAFAGIGGATAAVENPDSPSSIVDRVADAAGEEIDQAAAVEAAVNSNATDETVDERQAEIARKLGILAAFVTAASLLAGAVAAFFAAGFGGKHRDQNTRLTFFILRR